MIGKIIVFVLLCLYVCLLHKLVIFGTHPNRKLFSDNKSIPSLGHEKQAFLDDIHTFLTHCPNLNTTLGIHASYTFSFPTFKSNIYQHQLTKIINKQLIQTVQLQCKKIHKKIKSKFRRNIEVEFLVINTTFFFKKIQLQMKLFLTFFLVIVLAQDQCPEGELKFGNQCKTVQFMEGCANYSSNGLCDVCQQDYIKQNQNCEYNQICSEGMPYDKCLTYSDGKCTKCRQSLFLKDGNCLRLFLPGCLQRNSEICSNCAKKYYNQNGRCIAKILNCKQYNDLGSCIKCLPLFRLQNNICTLSASTLLISSQPNCLSQNQYACIKCLPNYFLQANATCVKYENGCLNYLQEKCVNCSLLFILSNGKCIIQGCKIYQIDKCAQCQIPYISENGKCKLLNCAVSDKGMCFVCEKGYILKDGKCIEPLFQFCQQCNNGYVIGSDKRCHLAIDGCSLYGKLGCQQCKNNSYLSNSKCLVKNTNCLKYRKLNESNEVCEECSQSFILSSLGICFEKERGCVYDKGKCISCMVPFIKSNETSNVCWIPGCINYTFRGCSVCRSPFTTENGFCKIENCLIVGQNFLCSECKAGYRINKKSGNCVIKEANCVNYNQQINGCIECENGYTLVDMKKCIKNIPNCIEININSDCLRCSTKYTLVKNICLVEDKFCQEYGNFQCSSCLSKYHFQGSKCVSDHANCERYNNLKPTQLCQKCVDGFYLDSSQNCYKMTVGCLYNNGVCVSCVMPFVYNALIRSCQRRCQDGFYPRNGMCVRKLSGCVYSEGICKSCLFPYEMGNGNKCEISGCLQLNESGCVSCKYPFQMISNKCKINNCQIHGIDKCLKCVVSFHVRQDGSCVKNTDKCSKYEEDGDCETCVRNYVTGSSGQCILLEDNCIKKSCDGKRCLSCKNDYYINTYHQCQKRDINCRQYNNGLCSRCSDKYFLQNYYCLPYAPGCVKYWGKYCIKCKETHVLYNSQCSLLPTPLSIRQRANDTIIPFSVINSQYFRQYLCPISKIGKLIYSSNVLTNKSWKSQNQVPNEYIGFESSKLLPFYCVEIQNIDPNKIIQFYLQYSVDGFKFIRLMYPFKLQDKNVQTVYFNLIYAKFIRIIVTEFVGWPSCSVQFFYYDQTRLMKTNTIGNSCEMTKMNDQQQKYVFRPDLYCSDRQTCWSQISLGEIAQISELVINQYGNANSYLIQFYLSYSIDGITFRCYNECKNIRIPKLQNQLSVSLNGLKIKNIRVFPTLWMGKPQITIQYCRINI